MAKDERRRKKKSKRRGGQQAEEEESEGEEEEEEEEEPLHRRHHHHHKHKHKLKLVLKLPRSYSSLQHTTNSSSSSIPNNSAKTGGFGLGFAPTGAGAGGGGLSDTLSSPAPQRRRRREEVEEEEQEAVVDVTVAHPRKPSSSQEDDGDDDDNDDDEEGEKPTKKRRLNAVAAVNGSRQPPTTDSNHAVPAGSAIRRCTIKAEKQTQNPEVTEPVADATSDPLSETPMPENGLLEFILDKLQKKDTYGVFAKPVDPNELPDYHEIIQNPMDFGTIRKKLSKGAYACFEQFEKDVFLVSTNAMHYNASDTIYYKQARAIQELARKKFQGIRFDPEGIEMELRLASKAKSGYSSKKLTRKPGLGRSQFEPAGSDFSSGATLATGGDHAFRSSAHMQDSSKIWKSEKPGNVFGNSDGMGFLAESNFEKAEEHSASLLKQPAWRNGRRPLQLEENRRATYRPFNQLENGNDSILTILDGESRQLVPVGIRSEHAYARSLTRFAANLGPVAWKIAAQKIRRALPPGVSFGPGWVGDYEAPPRALLSHEGKSVALSASSTSLPVVPNETKVKSNNCADTPILRDEGLQKNLISESRSVPSTMAASSARQLVSNTVICQMKDNCQSTRNPQSDVIGHAALNSTADGRVSLPSSSQDVKQGVIKPVLPVTTSNDLALTGAKFGSEVTQSRLLEMVSRNSTLMHGASLKQADGSRSIPSLQVMKSENIAHDSDARSVARKASDASKRGCSSAGTNVAVTAVNSSLCNYQAGSRAFHAPQITGSQEHAKQDLNSLANLLPGKMLALHQRGSSLSANTPVFVHSSVSSTGPSVKRDDATVQAWIQSQNACLADADATSRVNAPNPHMEQHESQARDFSALARFMPQELPLDTSRQALSQFSRFHPQNSTKVSNNTTVSGPVIESQGRNTVTSSHVQKPMGGELSKSNNHTWRGLPSQFLPEQDSSSSLAPDLNVRFQKSNSPAQQSSAMLADSQQPDLALQL